MIYKIIIQDEAGREIWRKYDESAFEDSENIGNEVQEMWERLSNSN